MSVQIYCEPLKFATVRLCLHVAGCVSGFDLHFSCDARCFSRAASILSLRKYEEIYSPSVEEFVYISDNSYTRDQVWQLACCWPCFRDKFVVIEGFSTRFFPFMLCLLSCSVQSCVLLTVRWCDRCGIRCCKWKVRC